MYDLMSLKQINVLLVQETHIDNSNQSDWREEWGGTVILSYTTNCSAGVAVLFSKYFTLVSCAETKVVRERFIIVTLEIKNVTTRF